MRNIPLTPWIDPMRNNQQSILCPSCRRLISSYVEQCPHCGMRRPGARWKQFSFLGPDGGARILKVLIAVNVVMFVITLIINPGQVSTSMNPLRFLSPSSDSLYYFGATGTIPVTRHGWWTLLSANYLHGGILHIVFNMMALNQLGPLVIREFGGARMFVIYTGAGVGGYLLSYLARIPFTIGASAAVCGLIGAALYYGKSRGGAYGQAVYQHVRGWILSLFVFGFLFPGINNWGHGGGLATGIFLAFLLGYSERKKELFAHRVLAGTCVACTMLVLAWAVLSGVITVSSFHR